MSLWAGALYEKVTRRILPCRSVSSKSITSIHLRILSDQSKKWAWPPARRRWSSSTRDQLYKIGLPRKSILGDYFQENRTSRRPFLLLRINFPGRPIFIQLTPDGGRERARLPGMEDQPEEPDSVDKLHWASRHGHRATGMKLCCFGKLSGAWFSRWPYSSDSDGKMLAWKMKWLKKWAESPIWLSELPMLLIFLPGSFV